MTDDNRRPVGSRNAVTLQNFAKTLVRWGLTPNQVSVLSMFFAAIAAVGVWLSPQALPQKALLGALLVLIGVQGRLVCNLMDGLMAIEGGLKTPTGEMYNEIPDRVSDTLIFLSIGVAARTYCESAYILGWVLSFVSLATAYIRLLGVSMTRQSFFSGPLAKQHRMFVVNIGAVLAVGFHFLNIAVDRMWFYLLLFLIAGVSLTVFTRMFKIKKAADQKV